jgi:hypothetical protein
MTTQCPLGHASATDDYCDECGTPLSDGGGPNVETNRSHRTEMVSNRTPVAELCARCGTPRPANDRFCEGCGHDFTNPAEDTTTRWVATIAADRAHFEATAPDGLAFPSRAPATVTLEGDVLIGRRSDSQGIQPDIDLSGPLDDPGVSRRHATLTRAGDGSYQVTDLDSTNGTALNDGAHRLAPDEPVALADGDRILLGAWTAITLRAAVGRA